MQEKDNFKTLQGLIEQHKQLDWPDDEITEQIMLILGIHEIVDLEFTLNSRDPRERAAAMKMLEKFIPKLMDKETEQFYKAKEELSQMYYKIDSSDEEGIL